MVGSPGKRWPHQELVARLLLRRHRDTGWRIGQRPAGHTSSVRRHAVRFRNPWVSQITVSVRKARPSLKYCLIRGLVVTTECGIDSRVQYSRTESARSTAINLTMENERNLIGATDIQMVTNDSFK